MKGYTTIIITIFLLFVTGFLYSNDYDSSNYRDITQNFSNQFKKQKAEAVAKAKEKGWVIRETSSDGKIIELQKIGTNGLPIYNTTTNINAAYTVGTSALWTGGTLGLDLSGSDMKIGEWDGGGIRTTHIEFTDDEGNCRVTQRDEPTEIADHATHVAGTLIAEGQATILGVEHAAKGMSYKANLDAYDWNDDLSEMFFAAAGEDSLILSNHSYGTRRGWSYQPSLDQWYWLGDVTVDSLEDYSFGFYNETARNWDFTASCNPYYLIVKSAGNDRGETHTGWHYYYDPEIESFRGSSAIRDADGGIGGYDCLPPKATAKNILVVGAVRDINGGYVNHNSVNMSTFSSWGPCDDGRIKPDIVGNGVDLLSPIAFNNLVDPPEAVDNHYAEKSGTSMASPNVCGSLALFQSYYKQLHGEYMKAATLKGLVINTADEAGPNIGPDYMFGWGLLDSEESITLMRDDNDFGELICQEDLENDEIDEFCYYSDGTENITITICWTDIPGTLNDPALNSTEKALVNDLDLRLIKEFGSIYYPWKLNVAAPDLAATTGDNDVDNVEQIFIESPEAGFYTIQISHKDDIGNGQEYSLIINGMKKPGTWKGTISQNWHEPGNWSANAVPSALVDITIPVGYDYFPNIYASNAQCRNVTIEAEATLRIFDEQLSVHGTMTVFGTFELWHPAGVLFVYNDIDWKSGSTANINASNQIKLEGNWYFREGSDIQLADGSVQFMGNTTSVIYVNSENCYFNKLNTYINSPGYLELSSTSTASLLINSDLYINSEALLQGNSTFTTTLKGDLINNGICNFDVSEFVFNGATQVILSNAESNFNDLIIEPSNSVTLASQLNVEGDLRINSGTLEVNDNIIAVGGNWTNLVGDAGFEEGTGLVKFIGSSNQQCNGEIFSSIELDKSAGILIFPNGSVTSCQSYNWTDGTILINGGNFTVNDIFDNAIKGTIFVTGGVLNLHQDLNHFIDLNADLTITAGYVNIYGGYTTESSYWSYYNDTSLTMSGGILDFKDRGIIISNIEDCEFTENITGGTIRTAKDFICNRPDFNPSEGIVELYGSTDALINMVEGSNFANLTVNKSNRSDEILLTENDNNTPPLHISRNVKNTFHKTENLVQRSNTLSANSAINVLADLTIQSGVFDSDDSTIFVGGNWNNNAGTAGFIEGEGTVIFNGSNNAEILNDETFYNLVVRKTNDSNHDLKIANNTTTTISNDLDIEIGTFYMDPNSNLEVVHNLTLSANAGLNANLDEEIDIFIGKKWINENTSFNSYKGFYHGYSTVTFNGATSQTISSNCAFEEFYNLMIQKSNELIKPYNNIHVLGDMTIANGTWFKENSEFNHVFYGDFSVTGNGVWDEQGGTITFKGLANQNIYTQNPANAVFDNTIIIDKSVETSVSHSTSINDEINSVGSENKLPEKRFRNQLVFLQSDFKTALNASLTIEEGTLSLNGNEYIGTGDIVINDGGTLYADAGSQLTIGHSLTINNNGKLELLGTEAENVLVTRNIDNYQLNVESGGTISTHNTIFEYMSAAGINVKSGGIIDAIESFDHCTFRNGLNLGTLLTINNDQTISLNDVEFPANTWSGSNNITKTNDFGRITFVDANGDFAGFTYEDDIYDRIDWAGFASDLIITNVIWSDNNPYVGDILTANVTIKNIGNSPTSDLSNIDFYPNQPTAPILHEYSLNYIEIPSLNAGDSTIVVYDNLISYTETTWTSWFQLDSDQFEIELNEENNIWGPDYTTWHSLPSVDNLTVIYNSNNQNIELTWDYDLTVDSFNIYRSTVPDFIPDFGNPYATVAGSVNTWNEIVSGTKYFYIITAVR